MSANEYRQNFVDLIRSENAALDRWWPIATAILAHHHRHSMSDQSLFALEDDGEWEWRGEIGRDANAYLSTIGPQYLTVTTGSSSVRGIAHHLGRNDIGGDRGWARAWMDVAEKSVPVVASMLLEAVRGGIEWDNDESLRQAATRIAYEAAWRSRDRPARTGVITGWLTRSIRTVDVSPGLAADAVARARAALELEDQLRARRPRLGEVERFVELTGVDRELADKWADSDRFWVQFGDG